MSYLFYECSSLEYLPDISKWKINKVENIDQIFSGCSSLEYLPDLSKWNTDNIIHMGNTFENCSSLKYLPDISNWNVNKVQDISYLFSECSSLLTIPDISKWNINYLCNIKGLFYGCTSVISFPDISKWKIYCFIKDDDIFDSSLKSTEISYFLKSLKNESNNENNNFENYFSLTSLSSSLNSNKNNIQDLFMFKNENFNILVLKNFINNINSFISTFNFPKFTNAYDFNKEIPDYLKKIDVYITKPAMEQKKYTLEAGKNTDIVLNNGGDLETVWHSSPYGDAVLTTIKMSLYNLASIPLLCGTRKP